MQESTGVRPGTRWVARFVTRYGDRVKSPYLRTIVSVRVVADNSKHYSNWFEQVYALVLS